MNGRVVLSVVAITAAYASDVVSLVQTKATQIGDAKESGAKSSISEEGFEDEDGLRPLYVHPNMQQIHSDDALLIRVGGNAEENNMNKDISEDGFADEYGNFRPLYVHSKKQRMHPDDALAIYRIGHLVGELFDRLGIIWWATDGTLLGTVRNKGIIPHDDDIDLVVLEPQLDIILSDAMQDILHANNLHRAGWFWKGDRIYIWDYSSFNKTDGRVNSRNCKLKIDLWPVRRHKGSWKYIVTGEDDMSRQYPGDVCVSNTSFEKKVGHDRIMYEKGVHGNGWHCALQRWKFGAGEVWAPSRAVSEAYLSEQYHDWRRLTTCKATLHGCKLIVDADYDLHGHAKPTHPLVGTVLANFSHPANWTPTVQGR